MWYADYGDQTQISHNQRKHTCTQSDFESSSLLEYETMIYQWKTAGKYINHMMKSLTKHPHKNR